MIGHRGNSRKRPDPEMRVFVQTKFVPTLVDLGFERFRSKSVFSKSHFCPDLGIRPFLLLPGGPYHDSVQDFTRMPVLELGRS